MSATGVPELTQAYDAGFRNGVLAVFQQLEGIEDYEGLQDLIAEYWGEDVSHDWVWWKYQLEYFIPIVIREHQLVT